MFQIADQNLGRAVLHIKASRVEKFAIYSTKVKKQTFG